MSITPTKTAAGKTEGMLQSAEEAVENTRAFAQDSLDRATDKVHDLRRNLEPAIDQLASRAEKAVRSSLEAVTNTSERAQQTLHRYADATGRYVAEQPVKSVLIAAATGAAVAALFMALHGRNRH
jgi:ElaB/YqjD/DUF883 family membrane-anchored ribosome-binding protein